MAMRSTFIIWVIWIGVTLHAAESASRYKMSERCRRVSNELDENSIFTAQQECDSRPSVDDYFRDRKTLINYEEQSSFGSDIKLTDNEEQANKIIMQAKEHEYQVGTIQPLLFNPARHIFEVLDAIKQSKLFQIIKKMPKGGILHAHDTALCSANYLVSLTYWPDLWQRISNKNNQIEDFLFSRQQPNVPNTNQSDSNDSQWRLVKDVRNEMGAAKYDEHVRTLFTLFDKNINPRIQFPDINEVWNRFMGIFMKVGALVTYAPVWKDYYKHALKEMQEDGVQYLEFRGTLPKVFIALNYILLALLRNDLQKLVHNGRIVSFILC